MQAPIGDVYGYRLDPTEDGALVTSHYDWCDVQEIYRPPVADIFPVISETELRATLGVLARSVAPVAPPKRTAKGEAAGGEQ